MDPVPWAGTVPSAIAGTAGCSRIDPKIIAYLFLLRWPAFPLAGIEQESEPEPLKTQGSLKCLT